MGTSANPIGRWAIIVALGITVLMIIYAITGGTGYIALGMSAISLTIAAFIYLFFSPMSTVQRAGGMTLVFTILIAFLLPYFLLSNENYNAESTNKQYESRLQYAAGKYATYCSQCHGLLGQGINGPQLNNGLAQTSSVSSAGVNKNLSQLSQQDITRIITSGIVDSSDNKYTNYLMPQWGEAYGGPFNDDDINALVALVMSSDPTLRLASVPPAPTNTNGFSYVYPQLTATQLAEYNKELAQLKAPKGQAIDLTKETAVTMPIVNVTGQAVSWNFVYTDPTTKASSGVIKIKAGTKVTWINTTTTPHSISSGAPGNTDTAFASDPLIAATTGTYTVTFDKPGTYPYYCSFHPAMVAEIQVVA